MARQKVFRSPLAGHGPQFEKPWPKARHRSRWTSPVDVSFSQLEGEKQTTQRTRATYFLTSGLRRYKWAVHTWARNVLKLKLWMPPCVFPINSRLDLIISNTQAQISHQKWIASVFLRALFAATAYYEPLYAILCWNISLHQAMAAKLFVQSNWNMGLVKVA